MAEKSSDYDKSIIDIKIKFDKERTTEFENILRKQFGSKLSLPNSNKEDDSLDKIEYLEADFSQRANEIKTFRKGAQCAASAPILTQALVKKAKKRLDTSTDPLPDRHGLQKFRLTARIIMIFITLAKKWIRYEISGSDVAENEENAGFLNSKYFKRTLTKIEDKDKNSESKKGSKSKYWVSEELQATLKTVPEKREEDDLIKDFLNLLATKSSLDNSNTAFARSIALFQSFPWDSIAQDTMTTKYFPKDTVIVKETHDCPYFFIVKSGTCKLLQKHAIDKRGVPIIKKEILPKIKNRPSASSSFTTNSSDDNHILNDAKKLHLEVSRFLLQPKEWDNVFDKEKEGMTTSDVEVIRNNIKKSIKVSNAKFRKPKKKDAAKAIPTLSELICGQKAEQEADFKLPLITLNSSLAQSNPVAEPMAVIEPMPAIEPMPDQETRRSSNLSNNRSLIIKYEKPDRDAYLEIGCLKKGDIYGLDALLQRATSMVQAAVTLTVHNPYVAKPNAVVISEGTECILVNKKLFLKSADFGTLARIVSMYQSQTTADEAKAQIEKRINWGSYKRKVVKEILRSSKERHKVFAFR
eukprot:gene7045-7836_t